MARGAPTQTRLQFKLPLKGCTNAELQKRLRALHEELAEIDQELIVTSSLDNVAKELISHSLLLHKEKGVKAYLACCLADVLRLYAPEAPYTEAEIKVSRRATAMHERRVVSNTRTRCSGVTGPGAVS